jgi:5-methylcytosine-specific restriction endonuclease McrA
MVIHKKWRDANPEKCRSKAKKWRAENTARAALREKRWCAENPEKVRATKERWHAANPGKFRLYKNRRRARKRAAGGSHTVEQIADLFKKQNGKCVGCICSIKHGYHVDHIIALSKGGSNDISNIQLLCALCNKRKNNKDPIVWAQENGRLI